jgi:hypothetical protein
MFVMWQISSGRGSARMRARISCKWSMTTRPILRQLLSDGARPRISPTERPPLSSIHSGSFARHFRASISACASAAGA